MTSGPLVWVLIMLVVAIFLLPYFTFNHLFTTFEPYGSLSLVPLCLGAYFRSYRGALLAWGMIALGIALSLWMHIGLFWPRDELNIFISGRVIELLLSLAAVRFFRMHRQLVTARLTTQQQELEMAQQQKAYELQQQLNKLKDQLILNLSHELRTPLTEVYGYLELLGNHRQQLDEARQACFLASAMHGCDELLELVNALLDVNVVDQKEPLAPFESISVAQFLQEMLDQWHPQARQSYEIIVHVPEELLVWANPQHLRRILRNLLSNAIKYSPGHSQIVISATVSDGRVQETVASPQICLCVKDEGLGIPSEEIPLLFNKFVRLKRDLAGNVRGTGLGLYMSKQLVEAMDGQIWVESSGRVGEGSRFCFTLPVAAGVFRHA